ncbi:hypothetical protein B0T26DRAFT_705712 [Lasiosphaeria miniovina]|uniref:Uncharacterized protein n=1 Tax=Lasiosphaeria miniovina TaxID=1954250 RepID=A0AA40AW97_9PEZI|nr:uncharacterized protein B0T26DRAFT_705712 [Lasiosphaeria miniovina]KAK0723190.1 hypothetical protein B0T26DRAFT_705712 [Lasiosphaeria miniovina]
MGYLIHLSLQSSQFCIVLVSFLQFRGSESRKSEFSSDLNLRCGGIMPDASSFTSARDTASATLRSQRNNSQPRVTEKA